MIPHLIQMSVGKGVFTAPHGPHSSDKGQLWSAHRKTASLIFTRQNFRDLMHSTFVDKAHIMINQLNQIPEGGKIDMQQKAFAFTMDSIMKIFCGRQTNTLSGEEQNPYATAVDEAQRR
jgi:cytochrome P450